MPLLNSNSKLEVNAYTFQGIKSLPQNKDRRDLIRKTWGNTNLIGNVAFPKCLQWIRLIMAGL